ncbi:MAG: NAD(P)/FAD-dependent oxidoreductase [Calditrichaeota bacterium]|nr:NAD(P)/FAD-dependent oxidoreductase [Calditrichota bacterium]RQW08342.1 MAG: NAD(P)/FAD-dependent oxidoreductase [Calditrichota bacterium]
MYASGQLEKNYDIIVAGAGPAGCMAAWHAARENLSVLLLEKDREVGTPVRCAEGVARKDVEELLEHPVLPGWVAAEISRFRLIAPDGTPVYVNIDDTGYVLNRRLFDYGLALKAVSQGARLITSAEVTGVLRENGKISGVKVLIDRETIPVKSSIVIAADGVESRIARWAGIDSTVPLKDMETCVQFTLAGISIQPDTCDFYFSKNFAPGGYGWVFPKGERTANVGLGISGTYARKNSPEIYMERFLKNYFPDGSIISRTTGGVPVDKTLRDLVMDGFMVVGDAAHQTNPISGGGITSGMIAGKIAGAVAAAAVKKNKFTRKELLPYSREWQRRVGRSHLRYYRLKETLLRFSDDEFNRIAAEYLELPDNKKNILNLFKIGFKNHPGFLIDILKLFSPV